MQTCVAIKTDKTICGRVAFGNGYAPDPDAAGHLHFCRAHWTVYARHVADAGGVHHTAGHCMYFRTNRWCPDEAEIGTHKCLGHRLQDRHILARRQERQVLENVIREAVGEYQNVVPAMTWQNVTRHVYARQQEFTFGMIYSIAHRYFMTTNVPPWHFAEFWMWLRHGEHGEEPNFQQQPGIRIPVAFVGDAPVAGLGVIANDRQNVHTRPVSEQTNKSLNILLEIETNYTGIKLRAPAWLASKWLPTSYGNWNTVSRVVNDMYGWYNLATCRTANDRLYHRTLDGLYLYTRRIPNEETKNEIYKRIFEECNESVGMCCDGHISRLCNVLVGFDDAFKPPVPIGELIQNEMAKIAMSEADIDEKVRQAVAFFTEHNVPEQDRLAWLEAF